MKQIFKGNEKLVKMTCTKKLSGEEYRLSLFSYIFSDNGINIITNTLTGETYLLTEEENDAIMSISRSPVNKDHIIQNSLEKLVYNRFIVETEYNDTAKYISTRHMLNIMSGESKGLNSYTILPTTGCNARCVYCYEKGYKIKSMSRDTADRVIDYISETKHDGEIRIAWFGGEPLVGKDTISHICAGLTRKNIEFKSSMISNGSLFNEELIDEAINEWHLMRLQIALDGEKKDYEERKRYVNPERDNFERVIENVKLLASKGVKVSLRCNYDRYNLGGLKRMVDDLSAELSGLDNISLHYHILYQEYEYEHYPELTASIEEIYDYSREKGLSISKNSITGLRLNRCMADNIRSTVVIDPEGVLFNCEHLPENGTWGNIFDGITDPGKYKELTSDRPIEKECANCCFLPLCTSFYKKGCPNLAGNCFEVQRASMEHQIRSLIYELREKGEL